MNVTAIKRYPVWAHTATRNGALRCATVLVLILPSAACAFGSDIEPVLTPPPGNYRILSEDRVIRIPFEIFRGDIRMIGQVNGREVRMLIDNGIVWDQLLFFGSPLVDSLGLNYDGTIEVGGSGQGDPVTSKTASGITISFPGVEFTEQMAVITPRSSGRTNMWEGVEGQVSGTFLKHFVVAIDFDNMVMTLTEPGEFAYDGKGAEIPMKPLLPGAWGIPVTLEMSDGRLLSLDFMMDLGDSNPLEIVTGGPHNIVLPDTALPASLGFGIQGETQGHFGRVRSVEIGGYTLENVLAGFAPAGTGGPRFHEIIIGFELLSRFNIIFDYPSQRVFIEPNRSFTDPFEYDMSGMSMKRGRGDYLSITRILPGSPASEAGLRVGDRVTQINGTAAAQYDIWNLRPMLRREGETVSLFLLRGNREVEVSITLKRLI